MSLQYLMAKPYLRKKYPLYFIIPSYIYINIYTLLFEDGTYSPLVSRYIFSITPDMMLHLHQSVFSLSALSSDSAHPLPLLPAAPSPLPLHHTFTHTAAIPSPSRLHICSSPPPSRLCFTLHVPSHPALLHPSSHQHPHAALPFSLPPHLLPQLICTPKSTPALQYSLYPHVSPTTLAPLRIPHCLPSIAPSAL